MIALAGVRSALHDALAGVGYNVSEGADVVPMAALVSAFDVRYHENIAAGVGGLALASCRVQVVTDRADEPSAIGRVDAVMSTLPEVLEAAAGPWHAIRVTSAALASPVTVGEQTYTSVSLQVDFYV